MKSLRVRLVYDGTGSEGDSIVHRYVLDKSDRAGIVLLIDELLVPVPPTELRIESLED